jgi:hypothetical protein
MHAECAVSSVIENWVGAEAFLGPAFAFQISQLILAFRDRLYAEQLRNRLFQ